MVWAFFISLNCLLLALLFSYRRELRRFFKVHHKKMIGVLVVATVAFGSSCFHEMRSVIRDFFFYYRDTFTSIGYTATVIGVGFVGVQLWEAKKKAKATFSYQLLKDGRELMQSVDLPLFKLIMTKDPEKLRADDLIKAHLKILAFVQYYAQAFVQYHEYHNINCMGWKQISDELELFLTKPMVEMFWNDQVVGKKHWNENFVELGSKMIAREKGGSDETDS